jgi:polar amino acid transport system substrate-binding protein
MPRAGGTTRLMRALALCAAVIGHGAAAQPARPVDSPDLYGVAAFLPSLLESEKAGRYARLMDTIALAHRDGAIHYNVTPMLRMYQTVAKSEADFGFPVMKLPLGTDDASAYRYSTEKVGVVTFVLYTRGAKPLSRERIVAAAGRGQPYIIEAPPGDWGFPTYRNFLMESAFKKLALGRLDGFIWAQEEADAMLRKLKPAGIRRAHFADFDEVLIVPRTARGDFVDAALTRAIRAARKNGSLAKAYAQVHRPYQEWQPDWRP